MLLTLLLVKMLEDEMKNGLQEKQLPVAMAAAGLVRVKSSDFFCFEWYYSRSVSSWLWLARQ